MRESRIYITSVRKKRKEAGYSDRPDDDHSFTLVVRKSKSKLFKKKDKNNVVNGAFKRE